jgi:hypothetical protein
MEWVIGRRNEMQDKWSFQALSFGNGIANGFSEKHSNDFQS